MNQFILILLQTCFLLLGVYLISYFRERAKNQAQKNDIKEITDKIESTKSTYSKEIEKIKSELQKNNQVVLTSLNSFISTRQAFLKYKADSFIIVWSKLREIRKLMNSLIVSIDMLENYPSNKDRKNDTKNYYMRKRVGEISISDFNNFFNEISEHRIFIEENLWNALITYYYFYVHLYVVIFKSFDSQKLEFDIIWHKDDELQKYIKELIPNEYDDIIKYEGQGRLQYTVNKIENHLIHEIGNEISGKSAAKTTIEINTNIIKLQEALLSEENDEILAI